MTIKYDRHVKDYIKELSETGHVYHTKYPKKSVTFHHNAGKLSFSEILRSWTFRKASAHFDVDGDGDVAQFVHVHEYAWAVGDTEGNRETISIEMANSTGAPDWKVDDKTWKQAARLAGWLFAHVIKEKPTHKNVLLHDHWSATECPGPYVHSIYDKILDEVQTWFHHFRKEMESHDDDHKDDHKKDFNKTEQIIADIQKALGITVDGMWGPETDKAVLAFRKKHLNKF